MTHSKLIAMIVLVLATALTGVAAEAITIKKCKDSQGRWHYGDYAAKECKLARATVIEYSTDTGQRREIKPPPTEAELTAREAQQDRIDAEKQKKEKSDALNRILLQAYAHEDDIIHERNRKLKELKESIDSKKATVASLRAVLTRAEKHAAEEKKRGKVSENTQKTLERAQSQATSHQAELDENTKELAILKNKYADYLRRFRKLKSGDRSSDKKKKAKK